MASWTTTVDGLQTFRSGEDYAVHGGSSHAVGCQGKPVIQPWKLHPLMLHPLCMPSAHCELSLHADLGAYWPAEIDT